MAHPKKGSMKYGAKGKSVKTSKRKKAFTKTKYMNKKGY